jgi:zinc transport system ATP-binding protein
MTNLNAPSLVRVESVSHRFDSNAVLQNVDLAVAPGEIVTLIGPNGAGKSTLVRIVLGLLRPSSGRVARRSGLVIGYMPQHFHIEDGLPITVRRFLSLARGSGPEALEAALAEVSALHLIDNPFQGLSGGETQRVLLARALVRNPDLMVLDEPVRGVDVNGQLELYDLITRIRSRRSCGILMVSHDLHLVMAATDRVICLNHHVCCAGRPEAVSAHPEYLALFGPATGERLAVYTHSHDHRHDLAGEVVDDPAAGRDRRRSVGSGS